MSAISLNHFLHQPWIQATLELVVTHLEDKDETPISNWSNTSNKLSFIFCQLSNVQVNTNYEDAMHMTVVRWHILFSHCSVLPIKPWMSLSLSGDTSTFHISPSNQSNPWCVCIKAPSASNASLHPSPMCIKGGGRKAQLHFFRGGELLGCVLVVVGVGLEETLSATRILGGWGHRQQTGSSPPRRCYNHTTHWHCTHFLVNMRPSLNQTFLLVG